MNRKIILNPAALVLIFITMLPTFTFSQTTITNNELIGKGNPKLFGKGYKLRQEAHLAFKNMQAEAIKSNIKIGVVSSYRSFAHQKSIWERKYKRNQAKGLLPIDNIKKIIEYSTIPGTSRHHWGTDIDIYQTNVKQPNSILHAKNYQGNGAFCELKEWMDTNSKRFGFTLVYTNKSNRKGFKYEPWHYSYKPLSSQYLKRFQQLDIVKILKKDNLLGRKHFSKGFIITYTLENILDINPELL